MTATLDPTDPLLPKLRHAIDHVFGDSSIGTALLQRSDDYDHERARMASSRGRDLPVVAIVGATGQGKTWLAQALIHDTKVQAALLAVDSKSHGTHCVTWIGSTPPDGFDPTRERYCPCSADQMQPLGSAYYLVDSPGTTGLDGGVVEAARTAITQAAVHLLVVRRDQLRAGDIDVLAITGEGALVVPVVNAVRDHDQALTDDIELLLSRMRTLAPTSQVLAPVIVDDGERSSVPNSLAMEHAAAELSQRLGPHLHELAGGQRILTRLSAAKKRFHRDLAEQLAQQLPELSAAEKQLSHAASELPTQVALMLIGSPAALTIVIRTRLRLAFLSDTAAIWFPYRTLLGLLNLTHGAWDRLMLAMAGSLPSLITTAWSSATNLRTMADISADKHLAVHQRAHALVQDRLRPLIGVFRRELQRLRQEESRDRRYRRFDDGGGQSARLVGLDALQAASQQIFDQQISRFAPSLSSARILALLGTLTFWSFFAGPIISLYRDYLVTSLNEMTGNHQGWDTFPEPSAGMLFTAAVLSIFPTAVYAMCALAWAQSNRRVRRCAAAVQAGHDETIDRLGREGVLQLEFDDPLLDDARLLLSVGRK